MIQTNSPQKTQKITDSKQELLQKEQEKRLARIKSAIAITGAAETPPITAVAQRLRSIKRIETKENTDDTQEIIEELIKEGLSELSVTTLAVLMEDDETPPAVKYSVSKYVLDRILGRPTQREEVKIESTERKINITFEMPVQSKKMIKQVVCDEDVIIDV
jgi:hypothetical protein